MEYVITHTIILKLYVLGMRSEERRVGKECVNREMRIERREAIGQSI